MKAINKLALVVLSFAVLAKAHPGYLYAYPDAVGSSKAHKPIVTSPAAVKTVTLPCEESTLCYSQTAAMNATTAVVTTTLPCTECLESSQPPATPTEEPSEPEPTVPEPTVPEPAVPEPAVPEPAVPEPAVPEPAVPEPSVPPKPAPPLSTGPSAPAAPGPVGPGSPAAPSPTSPQSVPTFTGAAARYTINGYNFVLLATMTVFAIL